jgi:hypothetical protein
MGEALNLNRVMELAKSSYRPPEIVELNRQIEGKKRALMLRSSIAGAEKVSIEEIKEIVIMKLKLDLLYELWVRGKLE